MKSISLQFLLIACLTLGLAPFTPEPHIWQKLKMLSSGTLSKPVDIFDFIMHGLPFILLTVKLISQAREKAS
ncbi:MAG: RND transporter [Deltaproteobacteria bacterium]|nr:RND transporter [Deltaproteobacteria bacterium]